MERVHVHGCPLFGEDHAKKKEYVERLLREITPATVLDVGANTGTYSMLAASVCARVVALDTDQAAIDQLWTRASKENLDILPLVVNIARPSPALGWENSESMSFLDRAEHRFDLVMMLAVIHHLLLMDQIPMEQIAALAARLTRRYLAARMGTAIRSHVSGPAARTGCFICRRHTRANASRVCFPFCFGQPVRSGEWPHSFPDGEAMKFRTWLQGAGVAALVLFPFYRGVLSRPGFLRMHTPGSATNLALSLIANLALVSLIFALFVTWLSKSRWKLLRLTVPPLVWASFAEMIYSPIEVGSRLGLGLGAESHLAAYPAFALALYAGRETTAPILGSSPYWARVF